SYIDCCKAWSVTSILSMRINAAYSSVDARQPALLIYFHKCCRNIATGSFSNRNPGWLALLADRVHHRLQTLIFTKLSNADGHSGQLSSLVHIRFLMFLGN